MATARKLPSGNWRVNMFIGCDENKKRIYKSFTGKTKSEAEYMATEYKMFKKDKSEPQNMTVEDALNGYIDSKSNILSPSTIHGYKRTSELYMNSLKNIRLGDLSQSMIQQEVNKEASTLSRKTLKNTYGLLSSALKMYYPEFRYEITYPAKKMEIKELPSPKDIIEAITGTSIELPVLLALWMGMRLSEIKGLKYKDLKDGNITIQRAMLKVGSEYVVRENTKTYNSTRTLKLPQYIIDLIGQGDDEAFIVKETGPAIYKRFCRIIEKNGLPHLRFHDLRHLNASVMLQLGVPDKYAMERGGWSTNQTLKNVYQHTFCSERENVDQKIDEYFLNIQK